MKLDQEVVSIEGSKPVTVHELFGEDKTFFVLVRHLG
ncbi:hypothetical protein ABID52_003301 [Fictibacillus halophilus]|uniref:Uncharacterized protein n=1 Tax=Fictibacillus halophilus TaxID=1610490 RepID=A0ABV2LMB5_9BACL